MARQWTGVLARLGVPTGDDRIIPPGSLTNRDLPLPLMWQELSADGHGGSRVVGRIESLDFSDPGMVRATGTMLSDIPHAVTEQLEAGVIGPSVDLDDVDYVMDDMERIIITRGRIAGATLVSIPAFAGVSIELQDQECDPATEDCSPVSNYILASVRTSGWSDMPMADEGRAWDGDAAADRVFAWATDGDTTDWPRYARAFLRRDDDADPETRGAYGFGVADVIDGTLTIVPRGVFAAAAAVQGARTGDTPEDAEAMRSVLRGLYERMDREAPFALAASAAAPQRPSAAWFARPDVDRLTPLTITDAGRVFGHIAPWGECHVGLPGCVTAPSSASQYAYFHQGEQLTEEGSRVAVGTLTVGGGHASAELSWRPAIEHYDNVGTAVAKVVAGEDEFGIWVAGWVLPQTTPDQLEAFRASPVSGDWRRIGGALELVAVCSVNSAGFPVPRARVSFSHEEGQRSLVASFGIRAQTEPEAPGAKRVDGRALWAWLTMEG